MGLGGAFYLLRPPRTIFSYDESGFVVPHFGPQHIPWSAVESWEVRSVGSLNVFTVSLRNPEVHGVRLSSGERTVSDLFGLSGMPIPGEGNDGSADELARIFEAHARSASARPSDPPVE